MCDFLVQVIIFVLPYGSENLKFNRVVQSKFSLLR